MVQHLNVTIEHTKEVRILGGIGQIIRTNQQILNMPVQICRYIVYLNMFILPIAVMDMVIDVGWLETPRRQP